MEAQKGWRIRVGDYRGLYEIDDDGRVVDVAAVATGARPTIDGFRSLI